MYYSYLGFQILYIEDNNHWIIDNRSLPYSLSIGGFFASLNEARRAVDAFVARGLANPALENAMIINWRDVHITDCKLLPDVFRDSEYSFLVLSKMGPLERYATDVLPKTEGNMKILADIKEENKRHELKLSEHMNQLSRFQNSEPR